MKQYLIDQIDCFIFVYRAVAIDSGPLSFDNGPARWASIKIKVRVKRHQRVLTTFNGEISRPKAEFTYSCTM